MGSNDALALFEVDESAGPTGGVTAVATERSRGPWDARHCHGGPVAALLARAVERADAGGDVAWQLARLTVELTPAEAEELLRRSSGDDVMVALGASGVIDLFEDPDVEAHGMRERIVLLGVVAATAAASTSVAQAMPVMDLGGSGDTVTLYSRFLPGTPREEELDGYRLVRIPLDASDVRLAEREERGSVRSGGGVGSRPPGAASPSASPWETSSRWGAREVRAACPTRSMGCC